MQSTPVDYTAKYFHLSAGLQLPGDLSVGIAYESLGGDQNDATGAMSCRTPLATLHGFQGWADQFLSTPGGGIDDIYLSVGGKAGKWALAGIYHDFSAASGSADWGRELEFSAARPVNERFTVLLKAAIYDADSFSRDTRKFWILFTGSY